MKNGKIVQVMGPVIDVEFEDELPKIKDALEVELDGKKLVMEVSQHIGGNCVRCIMLAASEGLCKDMEVINTGDAIKVPVGDKTLGRLFNVVGETIDGLDSLDKEEHWAIHRKPPTFEEQSANVEILETGIKVIDLLTPYPKGGKIGLFGGAGVGKTVLIQELITNVATQFFIKGNHNYPFPILRSQLKSRPIGFMGLIRLIRPILPTKSRCRIVCGI